MTTRTIKDLELSKFQDLGNQSKINSNELNSNTYLQLYSYQYRGISYSDIGMIVDENNIAITLNNGSLIYGE